MKKKEYLEMLLQDIETDKSGDPLADVVDCVWIALSEQPDDFEVDGTLTPQDFYAMLTKKALEGKIKCIGPFEAAEIFAEKLGVKYVRPSKRKAEEKKQESGIVDLENFL